MKRIQKAILLCTMVLLLTGIGIYLLRIGRTVPAPLPAKRSTVTVFIHGTFHLPIMPKGLIKFVHNCIDKAIFAKKGLFKVSTLEEHYTNTWTKKFHNYHMIKTISQTSPERFPFESFYIFGWSGQLCPQKRLSAARKLHAALTEIIAEYRAQDGIEPRIQLITHSHGGNVALNLAKINNEDAGATESTTDPKGYYTRTPLAIDELILLACPVQYETSHFVHDETFKKIYSLHSHWDVIQVIDAQGWVPFKERMKNLFAKKPEVTATETQEAPPETEAPTAQKCFFSERHFEHNTKLMQANIYFGNRGMFHVEFISEAFMQHLPTLLASLDEQWKQYAPTHDNVDLCLDLNPMIKESRRVRLAAKKTAHIQA